MIFRPLLSAGDFRLPHFFKAAGIVALAALALWPLHAKESSLTVIELYTGASGPAYVQLTSFLINGKAEVRACGSEPQISRSAYGKLAKIELSAGASIEDGADGVLILTQAGTSSCVVPGNLKLEKNTPYSLSELANRAIPSGVVVGGTEAITVPPSFKPGVKIVFVAAADVELAEYLRAEHWPSISLWQDYLAKYPATSHTEDAKKFLVSLLVKDGENSLDAYRKSLPGPPRSYADLKNAQMRAVQGLAVLPEDANALKLREETHDELAKLVTEGRNELQAYKQALAARKPGYLHLVTARDLAAACLDIDPGFATSLSFQSDVNTELNAFDAGVKKADALMASQKYDESFAAIEAYTSFAEEYPHVGVIIGETYRFHMDRGQKAVEAKDWETAIAEFRKASHDKQTPAVATALKDAEDNLEASNNQKAADAARSRSQLDEERQDYVQAYEEFANLPPAQRALVTADMDRLQAQYIASVPKAASLIQKAYDPIVGLGDEIQMEHAYGYLKRAYELSQDPSLKDRMDNIGDKLSDYYLAEAKRYMAKPRGSAAGLGWFSLQKALPYKAPNLADVRDELTRGAPVYQMRSQLSIGVEFRDQTTRRDSAGFAGQLEDAIAGGLESSGFHGKVLRHGENPTVEPNFALIGDVKERQSTRVTTIESLESEYVASVQPIPNPEWNKTNREYEAAKEDLQTLQQSLAGINARGKKKEIADANDKIAAAEKKVNEVHTRLDAIPTTTPQDIKKPYTYTRRTVALTAIARVEFRIKDLSETQVIEPIPVKSENKQKFPILENVKSEDTNGIKQQGTEPDETQFQRAVEDEARDALIKSVIETTKKLPDIVYKNGLKKEQNSDDEAAAEAYILYLNSTLPESENPQRSHAEKFLKDKFNIRWTELNASP